MASLDFVYDLTKKFSDDHIDYLVVAIRNGKQKDKADVFYSLKQRENAKVLKMVLETVLKDIAKQIKNRKKIGDSENDSEEEK